MTNADLRDGDMKQQTSPYAKNAGNFIDYQTYSTASAPPMAQTASKPPSQLDFLQAPTEYSETIYTLEYHPDCCFTK